LGGVWGHERGAGVVDGRRPATSAALLPVFALVAAVAFRLSLARDIFVSSKRLRDGTQAAVT